MWYLIFIGFAILGVLFAPKVMAQNIMTDNTSNQNKKQVNPLDSIAPSDTIVPLYSKAQIEEKLKKLATTPPPTELSFGAMCYGMSASYIDKLTYICPICGEKTHYKKSKLKDNWWNIYKTLQWGLPSCRREIVKVKGVNIWLDESQFCKHCSKKNEKPTLCLKVNIGGESDTTKTCEIDYEDLVVLQEFLNGSLKHKGSHDTETPLMDKIDRIKKLLGIELKQ
jgi:ribosomal protein S18